MPATIIARPDLNHGYGSFFTKVSNQYKPYETRSVTKAQATLHDTDHKYKLLTSGPVSPSLMLQNRTTESQNIKTSLPVEEEVLQDNKPVDVEEGHAAAAVDPLCHIPRSHLSNPFTPNIQRVLKYLTGPTPENSHMEFPVGAEEFEILEREVDTGRVLIKPRLDYDYNQQLLTIDMPTVLHESFYDDLKHAFTLAIDNLPYHRMTIRPQIHMNYPLKLKHRTVMPDIAISLTATQGRAKIKLIPYVGETALSEEWDHVFEKMESIVAKHPETILVSIVVVREANRYASPPLNSIATETLHNRLDDNDEDPEPLSLDAFMTKCSTERSFEDPIKVGGHKWCHIQSVEYFVWIKGEDGKPIDMRNGKSEDKAHGTLLPELHMDDVSRMLERGMARMRDVFLRFQKDLDIKSAVDHSALENFVIPPFPIDWALSAFGVLTAVELTAHLRYVNWHETRFRVATKRARDSSYAPSDSERDGSSAEAGAAQSKPTRDSASTSKIPSNFTFRSIKSPPINSPSAPVASSSKLKATPMTTRSSSKLKATAMSKSVSKAKSELSKAKSKDRRSKRART